MPVARHCLANVRSSGLIPALGIALINQTLGGSTCAAVFWRSGPCLLALGSFGTHFSAQAQSWPAKPIRVIVPLTAGSATDVMARLVLDQVSTQLGQPIVIENRPGAGNTIGMGAVAKAEPDGYTILANSSTHTVTAATRSNLGFDMTDLAPIIPLGNMPVVMVFNPAKGYKKLSDFVAAAKAKPGSVNYASAGAGNSSHLNGERFRLAAGIEAVHLPFKGAPEAMTEVIAGRADFYFSPLVNALPFLQRRPAAGPGGERLVARLRPARRADHGRSRVSATRNTISGPAFSHRQKPLPRFARNYTGRSQKHCRPRRSARS